MNVARRQVRFVLFAAAVALLTAAQVQAQGTCPAANPSDLASDDAAINACIAAGGTVTLVAGSPGYILETGLVLATSNVVLQGVPGTKPILNAHPNLQAPMLRVPQNPYPTGWVIRDLAFNGQKDNASAARLANCTGDKHKAFNLQISGAFWTIERVDSDNTVCGSAMEIECNQCIVRNTRVRNSGTPYNVNPYRVSDGISVALCFGGDIRNNEIGNATDVNLVVGTGGGCRVTENWIWNTVLGQVGLAVVSGDHSTSRVDHNLVQSLPHMLAIGLFVGDHGWVPGQTMAHGGLIDFNDIQGADVLVAVDGVDAGTFENNTGSLWTGTSFPVPGCTPHAYTAGHFGSMVLQPGWVFQTYHPCPGQP
jgi:hypothetical protein